jgi:hypothetical protein
MSTEEFKLGSFPSKEDRKKDRQKIEMPRPEQKFITI